MGDPHSDAGSEALQAGWAEMAAADWPRARRSFRTALDLADSPAGWEGLSWAAWWTDDGETVLAARERGYRLYRDAGDDVGAARMAVWLACDQLDFRGAAAVADGWLRRAERLLNGREPTAEHGWLAFQQGYLATVTGDPDTALRYAERTERIGRVSGVPDLEMLGLALRGSTLVGCGEVTAGMRCLDEAVAMTAESTLPISGAWACCFLVTACTSVLDLERAVQWCDTTAEFAEEYGSRYLLAFCRAEYGQLHLWRGEWTDAEKMLENAVADFTHSRPAMAGAPLVVLAELRRRQGRLGEAHALLDRAGTGTAAQECRARLELDQDRPGRGAELAERALRQAPTRLVVERASLWELLARCRLAGGDLDRAETAAAALRDVARRVGTAPASSLADLVAGLVAAAAGRHDEARTRLEDAVDGFAGCRAPYESAGARVDLATSLVALGRPAAAADEARTGLAILDRLGARPEADRARMIMAMADRQADGHRSTVTAREREVLDLLAAGLTNRQLAERLVVSEHTVHRHVTNILRKLGLPSRAAAAAWAVRTGLTAPPGEGESVEPDGRSR